MQKGRRVRKEKYEVQLENLWRMKVGMGLGEGKKKWYIGDQPGSEVTEAKYGKEKKRMIKTRTRSVIVNERKKRKQRECTV